MLQKPPSSAHSRAAWTLISDLVLTSTAVFLKLGFFLTYLCGKSTCDFLQFVSAVLLQSCAKANSLCLRVEFVVETCNLAGPYVWHSSFSGFLFVQAQGFWPHFHMPVVIQRVSNLIHLSVQKHRVIFWAFVPIFSLPFALFEKQYSFVFLSCDFNVGMKRKLLFSLEEKLF